MNYVINPWIFYLLYLADSAKILYAAHADDIITMPICTSRKGEPMSSNYNDADNYCKDCDRSIYGKYPSCDTNIENDGKYTEPGTPCYCKCREGVGMVEQYTWGNKDE